MPRPVVLEACPKCGVQLFNPDTDQCQQCDATKTSTKKTRPKTSALKHK